MTDLRTAAQQALEALDEATSYDSRPSSIWRYFYPSATGDYVNLREFKELAEPICTALRAALAEPDRKPLTEEELEKATREVWRNLPSDFDYTTSSWVEFCIRYAERAHGITE